MSEDFVHISHACPSVSSGLSRLKFGDYKGDEVWKTSNERCYQVESRPESSYTKYFSDCQTTFETCFLTAESSSFPKQTVQQSNNFIKRVARCAEVWECAPRKPSLRFHFSHNYSVPSKIDRSNVCAIIPICMIHYFETRKTRKGQRVPRDRSGRRCDSAKRRPTVTWYKHLSLETSLFHALLNLLR